MVKSVLENFWINISDDHHKNGFWNRDHIKWFESFTKTVVLKPIRRIFLIEFKLNVVIFSEKKKKDFFCYQCNVICSNKKLGTWPSFQI